MGIVFVYSAYGLCVWYGRRDKVCGGMCIRFCCRWWVGCGERKVAGVCDDGMVIRGNHSNGWMRWIGFLCVKVKREAWGERRELVT